MECLTPTVCFDIFMDSYFTYFRLLTILGVNKYIGYTNALSKRNVAALNSAHQAKKQINIDSGWLERQQGSLHSFI